MDPLSIRSQKVMNATTTTAPKAFFFVTMTSKILHLSEERSTTSGTHKDDWIMDSGASDYMTRRKEWFQTLQPP